MEQYFSNLIEDNRYERSLISSLSLVEPDILKQSKFTDSEVSILKDIPLEKIFRQRNLKKYFAMDLLEKQFSDFQLSTFPKKNIEPELLKIKTNHDENKI